MSRTTAQMEKVLEHLSELRGALMWVQEPMVTRLLMAQLRQVEALARAGEEVRAATVLGAMTHGIRAAGPELWSGEPDADPT